MKHNLLTVLALSVLGTVGAASLEAQTLPGALRVHVPFEFGVAGKTLPSGAYTVLLRPSGVVHFVPEDGSNNGSVALATKGGSGERRSGPVLLFNRYGNQRFLTQVSNGSESLRFGKSRAEKDAAKSAAGAGEAISADGIPSASRP